MTRDYVKRRALAAGDTDTMCYTPMQYHSINPANHSKP